MDAVNAIVLIVVGAAFAFIAGRLFNDSREDVQIAKRVASIKKIRESLKQEKLTSEQRVEEYEKAKADYRRNNPS